MGHTIVGVFGHSGDADLAAAHLREEYALDADELDVIGEAEWDKLTRPALSVTDEWLLSFASGAALYNTGGDENPVGQRWSDKVWQGETLVVARTWDPEVATAIAHEMRVSGADRVDLLPH